MRKIKAIQESIFQTVESMFSVEVQSTQPIFRGRKNLKWIVTLSNGENLFVKQYDQQRYKGKLSYVKKALAIQNHFIDKESFVRKSILGMENIF